MELIFRNFCDWEWFHSFPNIVAVTREAWMSKIMYLDYNCVVNMHKKQEVQQIISVW